MISLNDTHPATKPVESYRVRREAMDAAVFVIGPHARHGFEYETWKCDGRWRWKLASVDERQPTAAMIKAEGGKRCILQNNAPQPPPCPAAAAHAMPHHTIALHTGSRLEKPAAPRLTALLAATKIDGGTPMAKTDGDGKIGPSFIVNASANDLQTREAMLNDLAPACNGLDIQGKPGSTDLDIPHFLKREKTSPAKSGTYDEMKSSGALRSEPVPKPAGKPPVGRKVAKAKTAPKAKKSATKAPTKRAGVSGGKSKTALVGELLARKSGCTTKDILDLTGWPSVSVPAQAKAVGLTLRKEKTPGEPTRYFGSKG